MFLLLKCSVFGSPLYFLNKFLLSFSGWKLHNIFSRPTFTAIRSPRFFHCRRSSRLPWFMHGRFRSSDIPCKVSRVPSTLPSHRLQISCCSSALTFMVHSTPNTQWDLNNGHPYTRNIWIPDLNLYGSLNDSTISITVWHEMATVCQTCIQVPIKT